MTNDGHARDVCAVVRVGGDELVAGVYGQSAKAVSTSADAACSGSDDNASSKH